MGGGGLWLSFWLSAKLKSRKQRDSSQSSSKKFIKFPIPWLPCVKPVSCLHIVKFPVYGYLVVGYHMSVLKAGYSPLIPYTCPKSQLSCTGHTHGHMWPREVGSTCSCTWCQIDWWVGRGMPTHVAQLVNFTSESLSIFLLRLEHLQMLGPETLIREEQDVIRQVCRIEINTGRFSACRLKPNVNVLQKMFIQELWLLFLLYCFETNSTV